MLKCIGYRFKSYHDEINGKQVDSDKLVFSYISDEEENLTGWESHTLEVGGYGKDSTQQCINKVERVFGVKVSFDQIGNLVAPELDKFVKKPVFISCSFSSGKAVVSRVIIDPTSQVEDKSESK